MPSRAIIPPKPTADPARHARAVQRTLDQVAQLALADFATTTATWSHGVAFAVSAPDEAERLIGTDNTTYGYVNSGTRAHTIRPRGRRLRFPSSYKAKTRPGSLRSGRGGKGGAPVFARAVRHPGTKPRNFDVQIAARAQKQLTTKMRQALAAEVGT